MPSDFHPLFLFLGNREELRGLYDLLIEFEKEPEEMDVRKRLPDTEGKARLRLVPGEGEGASYGLRPVDDNNGFVWVLNAWQAGQVALRMEPLLAEELKSGNDIIEFGVEGEIPVKVSRGEFTDTFLTPQHHLHPDY